MTTINSVATGPNRIDPRNQFSRDRFFCSARPALMRERANHPPPPAPHTAESSMTRTLAASDGRMTVMEEPVRTARPMLTRDAVLGIAVSWPLLIVVWTYFGDGWPDPEGWVLALSVVAWALVYALGSRRRHVWPWWLLGQWVSMTVVIGWAFARLWGWNWTNFGGALLFGFVAVLVWMLPVGLVQVHRTSWYTRRPRVEDQNSTDLPTQDAATH